MPKISSKTEAINFAEWISHRYTQGIDREHKMWFNHLGKCIAKTTEALYDLYVVEMKPRRKLIEV